MSNEAREAKRQMKDAIQAAELAAEEAKNRAAHQSLVAGKVLAQGGEEAGEGETAGTVATVGTGVVGRPSEYSEEEADRICAWIAEGRSLRSYCRLEHRSMETVYRWLRERREFRERYARAHDDRADTLADELVDIADEVASGSMEEVQAAKLRIDTRKWIASKLRPTKWGDAQAPQQRTNVTFNIGLPNRSQPTVVTVDHAVAPTIDAEPAQILGR